MLIYIRYLICIPTYLQSVPLHQLKTVEYHSISNCSLTRTRVKRLKWCIESLKNGCSSNGRATYRPNQSYRGLKNHHNNHYINNREEIQFQLSFWIMDEKFKFEVEIETTFTDLGALGQDIICLISSNHSGLFRVNLIHVCR